MQLTSGELERRRDKETRKERRKCKKLQKRKNNIEDMKEGSSSDNHDWWEGKKKTRPAKLVPNYFVAVQINDERVINLQVIRLLFLK